MTHLSTDVHVHAVQVRDVGTGDECVRLQTLTVELEVNRFVVCHVEILPAGVGDLFEDRCL